MDGWNGNNAECDARRRRELAEKRARARQERFRAEFNEKKRRDMNDRARMLAALREKESKELKKQQDEMNKAMARLERDKARRQEVLMSNHAVAARTANKKPIGFGSATERNTSYMFGIREKKYSEGSSPVPKAQASPRRNGANLMTSSVYVPSQHSSSRNNSRATSRGHGSGPVRSSPKCMMTQSVYASTPQPRQVSPKKSATPNSSTSSTPVSTRSAPRVKQSRNEDTTTKKLQKPPAAAPRSSPSGVTSVGSDKRMKTSTRRSTVVNSSSKENKSDDNSSAPVRADKPSSTDTHLAITPSEPAMADVGDVLCVESVAPVHDSPQKVLPGGLSSDGTLLVADGSVGENSIDVTESSDKLPAEPTDESTTAIMPEADSEVITDSNPTPLVDTSSEIQGDSESVSRMETASEIENSLDSASLSIESTVDKGSGSTTTPAEVSLELETESRSTVLAASASEVPINSESAIPVTESVPEVEVDIRTRSPQVECAPEKEQNSESTGTLIETPELDQVSDTAATVVEASPESEKTSEVASLVDAEPAVETQKDPSTILTGTTVQKDSDSTTPLIRTASEEKAALERERENELIRSRFAAVKAKLGPSNGTVYSAPKDTNAAPVKLSVNTSAILQKLKNSGKLGSSLNNVLERHASDVKLEKTSEEDILSSDSVNNGVDK